MRIAIGSDHAGFPLKQPLMQWLEEQGHTVLDAGTDSLERTDYPIYGAEVGRLVGDGEADFGVAVCGRCR